MRQIPRNKGTAQAADLPGDVLSRRDFTPAQFDRSLIAFCDLAADEPAMTRELARANEFYRAARGDLPEAWRVSISRGLDLIGSLVAFRPVVRSVVAADLKRRIGEHLHKEI